MSELSTNDLASPAACEPPAEFRNAGTYHWLQNVIGGRLRCAVWSDFYGDGSGLCWNILGVGTTGNKYAYDRGWRYMGPALMADGTHAIAATPEEIRQ